MGSPLTPDSFMECPIHGKGKPAFICQHLQHGSGLGFFTPGVAPTADDPWEQGWCKACEEMALKTGDWNDESEAFAAFRWVCVGCFEQARKRNA
jgi:hypothetical protein